MNFQLSAFNYVLRIDDEWHVSWDYLEYLKRINKIDFDSSWELFEPFVEATGRDADTFSIREEIEAMNRDIDEVMDFYFKKVNTENPKFSWEKE